jgi:hypothetical protein
MSVTHSVTLIKVFGYTCIKGWISKHQVDEKVALLSTFPVRRICVLAKEVQGGKRDNNS